MTGSEATVTDHPESHRWEIERDGERIGLLTYRVEGDVIAYLHAEVDPAHGGQGLASMLARTALDDARARGMRIRPRCPFVIDFVERHEDEYGDLVA
jgi:predicted GNAT family acetyltransferase